MSAKYTEKTFWESMAIGGPDECWPWLKASRKGYGRLHYKGRRNQVATRIAWELTHGHPGELCVLHSCDNPPCCNPRHLFLGTKTQNVEDRDSKGRTASGANSGRYTKPERTARGERHGTKTKPECVKKGEAQAKAKLTNGDVLELRRLRLETTLTHFQLATRFNISVSTVWRVLSRRGWSHI